MSAISVIKTGIIPSKTGILELCHTFSSSCFLAPRMYDRQRFPARSGCEGSACSRFHGYLHFKHYLGISRNPIMIHSKCTLENAPIFL